MRFEFRDDSERGGRGAETCGGVYAIELDPNGSQCFSLSIWIGFELLSCVIALWWMDGGDRI